MEFLMLRLSVVFFLFLNFSFVYAHSGNTNKDGCHNDRINGGYHCHNKKIRYLNKLFLKIIVTS